MSIKGENIDGALEELFSEAETYDEFRNWHIGFRLFMAVAVAFFTYTSLVSPFTTQLWLPVGVVILWVGVELLIRDRYKWNPGRWE